MELLELFETSELSEQENDHLYQCEKVIQEGIKTFKEVGQALLEIRENRLYRKDFKTFDEYCREKWGINKRYVNRVIEASLISNNLGSIGPISPTSEGQIRSLSKLEPELQREVWKEATEKTIKPTGEIVKELVKDAEKLNALVKELKNNNLMVFNSESELMAYAKSKLTSFNVLIDKLKTAESNELKLESNLDKMENEKIKLEYELQNTKKELSKLQALNINEDKILATMQRLQEFEAREKDLSEHIRLSNEMAKLIVEAREFFVNHAIRINTITVTPESRHNVRQMSAEVIKLVEDWLWVFRSQFSVQSNSIIKLEE